MQNSVNMEASCPLQSRILSGVDEHRAWYRPRKLPHFDGAITQSITIRLEDSLPKAVCQRIEDELKSTNSNRKLERLRRLEEILDNGLGSCLLKEEPCAKIVEDALLFLDQKRFHLQAWAVMPNHVHFLAYFDEHQTLSKALHSLKSFTANEIKKLHPETGTVWQAEYFDRFMRSEKHYWHELNYIEANPVAAKLCEKKEDFRWSSARFTQD